MHTISMLRRTLGLSSDNQVRNRIERIKDLLSEHIRRGPNNQIFLTDEGLELLKEFQQAYESGLTLTEASYVIRSKGLGNRYTDESVSSGTMQNRVNLDGVAKDVLSQLGAELALLRRELQAQAVSSGLSGVKPDASPAPDPWWAYLREDVDVS